MGALALFLLGSCKNAHNHDGQHGVEEKHENHLHDEHNENEEADQAHKNSDEIVLTPEKAKAAGVVVETVVTAPFQQVIATSGQLLPAQGDEVIVVANVAGVVHFPVQLTEGMAVVKGAGLVNISSKNLQEGSAVQRARLTYETAKSEYERAEKLIDSKIISQKEFVRLKENYENARMAYEALSPSKDGTSTSVKTSIGGYIKACFVKEGDYVTVGQQLVSVTQNRRLQLKADISERYYSQLSQISSANFKTPYDNKVYQLDSLKGKLLSYGKVSSESSFYIPVIFEFDNHGNMVPGSFVEVYLLSNLRQAVVSAPVEAITEEQGLFFVYLQLDEECYKKQEVKIGTSNGSRVEILSGLKEGDKLVTNGAMHIKLASASNAIPAHTHNH